jgi:hypothetical protein
MTEIAIPEQHVSDLMQWAMDAAEAHKIATSLVKTTFVPDSMRGKPDEATAAILTGQEIGLAPMAALRSIDIISGTPAMRAHALRGLVQSKGHEVWLDEANSTRAIVCGRRKGTEQIQRSVWTMDRAKALGLAGRDQWRKQPQAMLIARATAELCRLVASDVILGIPYAIEELGDDVEVVGGAPAKAKRTARRKPAAETVELPEPAVEPPVIEEAKPEPPAARDMGDGDAWPEPPADWTPEPPL